MSRCPRILMVLAAALSTWPGSAAAAPAWRRVESTHPVAGLLPGGRLVGEDGWIRWREPDGSDRAIPPPFPGAEPRYVLDEDGGLWHVTPRPATVRRWLDGAWSSPEDVGLPIAAGYAVGRGGRAWMGAYDGTVAVRRDGRWEPPRAVAAYPVTSVVPDGVGGAWLELTEGDVVLHLDADGELSRIDKPGPWRPLALDDGSLGWNAPDGPRVRDGDGWRAWRAGDPVPHGVAASGRDWLVDGEPVTSPCAVSVLVDAPTGPWVSCTDGEVLERIAPEGGHALARTTWDLGDLTNLAPVVVDLDLDGLDDVLLTGDDGTLAALVQRDGLLVRDAVPPGLPGRLVTATACDLDRDGRGDLVGWSREAPNASGARPVLARRRSGWFDDLAVDSGAPARLDMFVADAAPPRCLDADADGDLDVLVPLGTERQIDGPALALMENRGLGRFTWRADGRAPDALTWVTDVLPGDFDGDGIADRAYVAPWKGLAVWHGTGGGRGGTLTWGTGPWGTFHEAGLGWVDDLDGDGIDDLLVTSMMRGPRAWLGRPGLALEDATDELGLGVLATRGSARAAYADLDGVAGADLLTCPPAGGCRLLRRAPGAGFVDADASSLGLAQVSALTTLDLGGDGDTDLLVVTPGRERLLENRSRDPGPAPPPRPRVRAERGLLHALARSPLAIAAGITLVGSPAAAALLALPRERMRWVLALLGASAVLVTTADLPTAVRVAVAAAVLLGLAVWAGVAWIADRLRRARRIDRYVVLDRLGSGGLGTVYAARDPVDGSRVAVKVMHPWAFRDEEDRALFRREVELGSVVEHPALVPVRRWGETTVRDGDDRRRTAWLAMDLLEGPTLRATLRQRGPLPLPQAVAVIRALAGGLAALHARRVVHGDVKPENVILTPWGPVLTDFGAARVPGTAFASTVYATRAYAPPELDATAPPDPRTDVYALATMLGELLADPPPEALATVLAAARGPLADRPADAGAFALALAPFAGGLPPPPRLLAPSPARPILSWLDLGWKLASYLVRAERPSARGFATALLDEAEPRGGTQTAPDFQPTGPPPETRR